MTEIIELFTHPAGVTAAAVLIFIAGLSDGVGRRTVGLLINRLTPAAFLLSLLASALLFLLSAAIWIGGVWLAATNLFGMEDALPQFFYVVSVTYVPFLFAPLALLPLVGPLIRVGLRLWSFAIGLTTLGLLGLTLWQTVLCAVFGALLVEAAIWLLSEPAAAIGQRLWVALGGRLPPRRRGPLPRVLPGYAPRDEVAP